MPATRDNVFAPPKEVGFKGKGCGPRCTPFGGRNGLVCVRSRLPARLARGGRPWSRAGLLKSALRRSMWVVGAGDRPSGVSPSTPPPEGQSGKRSRSSSPQLFTAQSRLPLLLVGERPVPTANRPKANGHGSLRPYKFLFVASVWRKPSRNGAGLTQTLKLAARSSSRTQPTSLRATQAGRCLPGGATTLESTRAWPSPAGCAVVGG
jgi:hypothetical protein